MPEIQRLLLFSYPSQRLTLFEKSPYYTGMRLYEKLPNSYKLLIVIGVVGMPYAP